MDVGIAVKQQANKKKAAPPPPNPFTGLVEKRQAPAPPNPFGADDEDEDNETESKNYLITGDEVRASLCEYIIMTNSQFDVCSDEYILTRDGVLLYYEYI